MSERENVQFIAAPTSSSAADGLLQRACACGQHTRGGGECEDCKKKRESTLQRTAIHAAPVPKAPSIVNEVLASSGQPLEALTRAYMEPRFGSNIHWAPAKHGSTGTLSTSLVIGPADDPFEQEARRTASHALSRPAAADERRYDFSGIRIHADSKAAESARAVQASAYTVMNHIVFGAGKYEPATHAGRELLAHELTHVVQQEGLGASQVSRFADTDHNIIEEVALKLANFSPAELEQTHLGNTKRDYSQSPTVMNLALLCNPSKFGGYEAVEHFDNYRWDKELQTWKSRKESKATGDQSPVTHIQDELVKFVNALPDKAAFQHVGSAFHTIEDFFAHSNFIELTHEDYTHGKELITGSVGGSDDVSILKIEESISSHETAPYYGKRAEKEIAAAPEKSHAKMAKDYKSNPYHLEAEVLAGLVIKQIGEEVIALKGFKSKDQRIRYVNDVIMKNLKRYLRPPSPKDKWWEGLREAGGAVMEKEIKETTAKTPVTVNQCFLSPLKSIEANRDSNMKLFGPTFSVPTKYGHVMVQLGSGFSSTPAFPGPTGSVEPRSAEAMPVGVQITGRF